MLLVAQLHYIDGFMQISNLVLTSENRSHNHEPTGEVETLWGRMGGKMGDKVAHSKPKELEEKLDKLRKKYPSNKLHGA